MSRDFAHEHTPKHSLEGVKLELKECEQDLLKAKSKCTDKLLSNRVLQIKQDLIKEEKGKAGKEVAALNAQLQKKCKKIYDLEATNSILAVENKDLKKKLETLSKIKEQLLKLKALNEGLK